VDGAVVAQSLSGSVPEATLPHVPSVPELFFAAVQAVQTPAHAPSQHTPSTQKPERCPYTFIIPVDNLASSILRSP